MFPTSAQVGIKNPWVAMAMVVISVVLPWAVLWTRNLVSVVSTRDLLIWDGCMYLDILTRYTHNYICVFSV